MSTQETPGAGGEDELSDFVPAVYARSMEEAETYRRLLDNHDIPAILSDTQVGRGRSGITRGCAVLVPEMLLDDASRIIADGWPGGPPGEPGQPDQDGTDLDEPDEDDGPDDLEGEGPGDPPF